MDAMSSSFVANLQSSPPVLLLATTPATTTSNGRPSPLPIPYISAVRMEEKPPTQLSRPSNEKSVQAQSSPKPKPLQLHSAMTRRRSSSASPSSLPAVFCNAMDYIINNFVDPAVLHPSLDPRHVLSDNFAPVGELPPTPCPVIHGSIPPCLGGGAYIRNGPNPQHPPLGPYHLFEGDGMLHSLLLPEDGGTAPATLCSRYVHTYKYLLERDTGGAVLPKAFSGFNGIAGLARGAVTAARVLSGQVDLAEGVGVANTSLLFFHGRLYALGESDLPYAIQLSPEGDISTLGRQDFDGRLSMAMTAHPKKDPSTGELFAFRYGPVPPYLTYFRFDREGNKLPDVPIFSMREPSLIHDLAITQRYALFVDIQILMRPMDMVLSGSSPVATDRGKVPRIGLLPRNATSESDMRWFEVPGFNIFHTLNAWEEEGGDAVVLVAPNVQPIEQALFRTELVRGCVEMVRIDLRNGEVSRTPLSAGNLDFGVINERFVGRRNRYAYMGIGDPLPKVAGVAKLDFDKVGTGDCVVARRYFGPGRFGGEPFFVPVAAADEEDEDEGYLVSYVHNEGSGESTFIVMDARSPDLEVVAEILLPRRVPYGFHGLFVSGADIRAQQRPLSSSSLSSSSI